jgi:putative transposase
MDTVHRKITYRLYPTPAQEHALQQEREAHRLLYNAALEQRRAAWKRQGHTVTYAEQCRDLTALRHTDKASAPGHAQASQVTLKRVDLAFKAFFRRVKAGDEPGYPRFKSKKRFKGWGYKTHGDGWRLSPKAGMQHGRLWLTGIGHVKIRGDARTIGTPKTCELTYHHGTWYASITLACQPERSGGADALGLDWGINTYATIAHADGAIERVENPRWLQTSQERLTAAYQARDAKKKGSQAWKACNRRVARIHSQAARQRLDFQHKLSAKLVSAAAIIGTEQLHIAPLVRRPKARQHEQTGAFLPNGASQKAGLNRAILDGAPATLLAMLRYKAAEAGTVYGEASTQRLKPSQTCPRCLRRQKKPLSERWHRCPYGVAMPRDHASAYVLRDWVIEHLYIILLAHLASHHRSQELAPCHMAQNLPLEPQA